MTGSYRLRISGETLVVMAVITLDSSNARAGCEWSSALARSSHSVVTGWGVRFTALPGRREFDEVIDIRQEITAVIEATVLVVAALFPIVNPLGSAAIFVNLVGPIAFATQRLLAQKIAIYSFFLLLCSVLWGVHVLSFFGIQIYAVQIGGGLVVTATGWSLLNKDSGREKDTTTPEDQILENAFYPFTLPITVGPGAISVAITLGAHLPPELHEPSLFSLRVLI